MHKVFSRTSPQFLKHRLSIPNLRIPNPVKTSGLRFIPSDFTIPQARLQIAATCHELQSHTVGKKEKKNPHPFL